MSDPTVTHNADLIKQQYISQIFKINILLKMKESK